MSGLENRVLIFDAARQFCCTLCGHILAVSPRNFQWIVCVSPACKRYQLDLLRPDLASCEIMNSAAPKKVGG